MSDLLREVTPRARKPHRCSLCRGPINPGQTYRRATVTYDGTVYDWLECADCQEDAIAMAVWRWQYSDDGIDHESAREWAQEVMDDPDAPNAPREVARRFLARASAPNTHRAHPTTGEPDHE